MGHLLTNPQNSIWLTEKFFKGTSVNNICGYVYIKDEVNFDVLKKSINELVKTNDSMRFKFKEENDSCLQYENNYEEFDIETFEFSSESDIDKKALEMANIPFDFENSFLFKFILFKLPNNSGGFIVNVHHIIGDSWTLGLIAKEVTGIYSSLLNNTYEEKQFPSYINYINNEKEYINSEKYIKDKAYWDEVFKTVPELSSIPSTKDNKNISHSCEGAREKFIIPEKEISKIKEFCTNNKISIYNFFMAVYSLYLGMVSNLDDFVIGTPILNRTNFEQKHTMGMFISTAPLRINLDHDLSFIDFSKNIASNSMSLLRHQRYPYQAILEDLRKKDANIPNLYNVVLSYQITKTVEEENDIKYSTDWVFNGNCADELQIHLFDLHGEDSITVAYDYKSEKYDSQDIKNLHARVLTIINQVIDKNEILLKNIEIVTPEEKHKILYEFNNTAVDYPRDKTIVALFEEQVEKTPDNIAVVFENQKLTYRELNEKSNQVANYLIDNQVNIGDIIAILLDKSLEMIVAILGILKCGAAFLPIDVNYPDERISYIINNSKTNIIITNPDFSKKVTNAKTLFINIQNTSLDIYDTANINIKYDANYLAYIMYTSGSTGNPKGVMVTHKNIVRLVKNNKFITFEKDEHILQTGSIVFDACTFEIWSALLNGFKLYIITKEALLDTNILSKYLEENKITTLWLTAPLFNQLCEVNPYVFKHVKKLLTGGDVLSPVHINKARQANPNLIIINGYGPTENTTFSCCFTIDKEYTKSIPIGKPISNSTAYVVDRTGKLCPIGIPGELWVGGDGVAKGYLNNKTLTDEKFINNPFSNDIVYKTGDLVKWLKDGTLDFIGRIDNQVKIRGFRIELSEIDSNILTYPNIKQSVTVVQNINNAKIICSYIVANENINFILLKNYLSKTLASYMIPTHIIQLDILPLNTNGKIDRKLLPLPNINKEQKTIVSARNDVDKVIFTYLKNMLSEDTISIDDNLFTIGLDSLSAINLANNLSKAFSTQITVKDIFEYPIIKDLSDYICTLSSVENVSTIQNTKELEYYPLSSAQKRIYYASNLDNNSTLYNIAGGIIVDKILDINKLEKCFNILINRHEALRTHFNIVENQIVQIIDKNIDFKLDIDNVNTENLNEIYANFVKPFNLSKAPLFRTKLVKLNDNKMLILLDMHHIISDGTSINILLKELGELYNDQTPLSEKQIDYKDFTLWEKDQFNTNEFNKSKEYWLNLFKDEIPLLNMPTTYVRPSLQSFEGSNYYTTLSKEIFNNVQNIAKKLGITPYMLMLSAYYILLSKYTTQNDIVIGTPIVGRELPELSNIIGMFVNTLALRNKIDHSLTFKEFSKIIKENCLESFRYQNYPFDMLVKDLDIKRDSSRNPLFDVVFTYQNNGYTDITFDNTKAEYSIPNNKISKFDLTLEVIPTKDEYSLRFEYCTKLFDKEFIERMSSHYINILTTILENSEIKIANIDMLSKDERNKILYDFNNIEAPTNNDTFVTLFEEQVKKHPNNIALICEDKSLTYSELNKKANSLAHFLINNNVQQNDIIAIMTDRSLETIVCMLGILKAGAAFVNMDPTYPIERTTYYLKDCKAKCVLKQKHLNLPINNFSNVYEIDLNNDIYKDNIDNPNISIDLQSLSYIIYTSGSTGTPKGVVLNHIGLANMCKAMTLVLDYLKEGPKHTLLSVTSTPFDIFVYEIVVPLSHGMKIVLANNAEHRNPKLVDELIRKYNTDVMTVTPSLMKINYDNREPNSALSLVKNMVFGGEPLSEKFVRDLKALASDITVYNIYGPSEITVLCNVQNLDGEKEINIGPPILNNKIYILDNDMNPVPIGFSGEIYIGGVQVGCGYLGKEDLTNEKFIKNPFADGKMFKSGDIGRWTKDGKLQCLGRMDHQVKLRGLRIELGEIEKILEAIPEVDEAVINKVVVNDKEALCAYYVLNSDIDETLLRTALREKLPYYMVPTYFMKLSSMPYSINRKIDRKALPAPHLNNNDKNKNTDKIIKSNSISDKLLHIFKNVLNISNINITDNFFDIGGDSIAAIQVQIEAVKHGINIEYSDIFKYPTIKQLADNINKNEFFEIASYSNSKINKILERNTIASISSIRKTKVKNILVIGTTGYLGVHLIHEFLTKHKGNVYCLIRPKNRIEPKQRLEDIFTFYFGTKCFNKYKKRMIILNGDITKGNLGLSQKDINVVKEKVDTIINSGALVKHYGEHELFENINVFGTQNVVDFCLKHNKRLLHISTISVSGNGEKVENVDSLEKLTFSENNLYVGQKVNGIYTYTKYKAESIVLDSISKGLDALILRVGNITNRYSDGVFQRNFKDNAFAKRIKSFVEIGAFPEYLLEHELELTPVDLCSEAIIKNLYYKSNCNILHIYNTNLLSIKLFIEVINSLNIKLTPVSNELMANIITGILEDNSKKDYVSGIIYDLDNNKNLIYTSNIILNSTFSNKYLSKIGFSWKKINKHYLKKCFKHFNKIGFINF